MWNLQQSEEWNRRTSNLLLANTLRLFWSFTHTAVAPFFFFFFSPILNYSTTILSVGSSQRRLLSLPALLRATRKALDQCRGRIAAFAMRKSHHIAILLIMRFIVKPYSSLCTDRVDELKKETVTNTLAHSVWHTMCKMRKTSFLLPPSSPHLCLNNKLGLLSHSN